MSGLTDKLLEGLSDNLECAQNDLIAAELAYVEASAERETAQEAVSRLKAAVAALSGESPPATIPKNEVASPKEEVDSAEWEAEQNRKRRLREKELEENNPLAHLKCSGCGKKGSMAESYVQAPSGSPVRMLICGKCGNQAF